MVHVREHNVSHAASPVTAELSTAGLMTVWVARVYKMACASEQRHARHAVVSRAGWTLQGPPSNGGMQPVGGRSETEAHAAVRLQPPTVVQGASVPGSPPRCSSLEKSGWGHLQHPTPEAVKARRRACSSHTHYGRWGDTTRWPEHSLQLLRARLWLTHSPPSSSSHSSLALPHAHVT